MERTKHPSVDMDRGPEPKFCLSGSQDALEQENLEKAILALGGTLLKGNYLHPDCTHLLVSRLGKTEKMMSGVARGLPILALNTYLEASLKVGHWILNESDLLPFDVGTCPMETTKFEIAPLQIRRKNQGHFCQWRVALFLSDPRKANTYERVLLDGGAEEVTKLEVPFNNNELDTKKLTHLLSEPSMLKTDETFKEFALKYYSDPNYPIHICSYLIVVENLYRQKSLNASLFSLISPAILKIHESSLNFTQPQNLSLQRDLNCSQPMSTTNISIEEVESERKRRLSIVANGTTPKRHKLDSQNGLVCGTPSIQRYFTITNPKVVPQQTSSVQRVQKSFSFPMKQLDDQDFQGLAKPVRMQASRQVSQKVESLNKSTTEVSSQILINKSEEQKPGGEIGREAFRFAQDCVGQQKASELLNVCPKSKLFLDLEFERRANRKRKYEPGPLQYCFQSFFDTYTKQNEDSKQESEDLWLTILNFLEGCVTSETYLNLTVLHSIMINGIRDNPSKKVRQVSFGLIYKSLVYHHPPSCAKMRNLYLKTFITQTVNTRADLDTLDTSKSWEFICDLMERVSEIEETDYQQFQDEGSFILLDLVVTIIEMDLTFANHEFLRKQVKTLACNSSMTALIFWPHSLGAFNSRIRKLVNCYLVAFESSSPSLPIFRRLMKVVTMVLALAEVLTGLSENKQAMAMFIARRMTNVDSKKLWHELYMLESEWLSAMISYFILAEVRGLKEMSLRHLEQNVWLPPEDRIVQRTLSAGVDNDVETPKEDSQGDLQVKVSTANPSQSKINVNKKNKYGETVLHSACKLGNVTRLKEFLSIPNVDVNAKDHFGWTPLHEAASHGRLECVKLLLEFSPRDIKSFFSSGSGGTRTGCVDIWSTAGLNEGGGNEDGGITPLHRAVTMGHLQVVDHLLQTVAKREGALKMRKMLEQKTANKNSVFDFAESKQMLDLLERYRNNSSDSLVIEIDFPLNRYWLLSYIFYYKYCALFRLQAVKELMKNAKNLVSTGKKIKVVFRDSRDPDIVTDINFKGFAVNRNIQTTAQDIKTFWRLAKLSEKSPMNIIMPKDLF